MNHYFTDNRHLAQNRKEITFRFSCFTCHFLTDNGVFCKDHVDFGTRTLLDAVHASGLLGEEVLDLGCGYGVIGITLKKQYPDSAFTLAEVNPRALELAQENAARNGVADRFKVLVGDLSDKASGQYNIITANIVAAAILSLAPHVPVLMAPGARFIASGIIDERKDEVLAGLKAAGLEPVEVKEKRGWVCIICEKKEA